MQRLIKQQLTEWVKAPSRQPLLLRGARQTGKTYLIDHLGANEFEHCLKINLEKERHFIDCFQSRDPKKIIESIELISNQTLIPGKSLLFIDEIQECPEAIVSLRYFYEEHPDLHIIGAGSLLEFALQADDFNMPVGRVTYLYLYPMTFIEFLLALGEKKLVSYMQKLHLQDEISTATHNQLITLLRYYFIIGGMPKIVELYAEHQKLTLCRQHQSAILNSYRDDFGKYTSKIQHKYCERVFSQSLSLITKNIKYTDIDPDMDSRSLKQAFKLLFKANILTPIYHSSAQGIPLSATQVEKHFKVLFLDLGLVQAAGRLSPELLLKQNIMQINQGALTEQFIGQHLLTLQPAYERAELFYWKRDKPSSQAEIDYVMSYNEHIIPLEVKSGKTGRLKSMHLFMETHNNTLGIKLSTDQFNTSEAIWSIPLYLVEQLPRLLAEHFKE